MTMLAMHQVIDGEGNIMVKKQKYQAYSVATQTVAPSRQIVLLYDGVIRCIQQAKEAIVEKRIEDRYNLLIRAAELIGGLQGCLDFDNGGEIAKILYGYYSNIEARVFTIHRTNDVADCDAVIADLKQMRDAWEEIDRGVGDGVAAASANFAAEGFDLAAHPAFAAGESMSFSA